MLDKGDMNDRYDEEDAQAQTSLASASRPQRNEAVKPQRLHTQEYGYVFLRLISAYFRARS